MHPAAFHWAKITIPEVPGRVLEIGGADINGSIRNFFYWNEYTCVDIEDANGVDVVAPFVDWAKEQEEQSYDLIVCFEVFEHTPDWRQMVNQTYRLLSSGGRFIGTCASGSREPHSSRNEDYMPEDEYYENVKPSKFVNQLEKAGYVDYRIDVLRRSADLRWTATKWVLEWPEGPTGTAKIVMNPYRYNEMVNFGDVPR